MENVCKRWINFENNGYPEADRIIVNPRTRELELVYTAELKILSLLKCVPSPNGTIQSSI